MATARHPKATFFVQRQLFAGLTSFAELEQKIAALRMKNLAAMRLKFSPKPISPRNGNTTPRKSGRTVLSRSMSLKNLAFRNKTKAWTVFCKPLLGQFNAYQIKFRTGRPSLTWRELSTFIGLADSPHIHSRVLLTNCDELPAVLNDRQGFFCIRGSDLDRLEAGDFPRD